MKNKTWKDYQCCRCNVTRGVKMYTFSEDGFIRQANLCRECADETHVYQLNIEFLRKQKEENGKENIS